MLSNRIEISTLALARVEPDLEQASALASGLPSLRAEADDDGKREILETVFVRFVVDRQKIVDVEVRPPYSWLLRLKPEGREIFKM